ncbi:glucans biosynthesis glucosyltransferase MdoH [Thioalkalivibrio sp.]|uniref:glucans biosynthesis glucosyltransferase MdoH n=1 Tax=Thioalkalivibrio sp. TaxID=2093813 RepID=UPI0012D55377|nr:glucans biosynthesis glucosyltransferase MdoH [Thioalkalivibrio sp.]TVP77763.1 MAG: glucans biosynthesis glucosyltransferase MdoH [Thioalkalivibrio sp.]
MNAEPLAEQEVAGPVPGREGVLQAPAVGMRRGLFFGLVMATVVPGAVMMALVLQAAGMGPFQWAILLLFLVTFTWIAVSFWTAVAGFVLHALRLDPLSLRRLPRRDAVPESALQRARSTAIVVPIHNEDPVRVVNGIEATCRSLLATGQGAAFDLFLLSDSTDPAVIPDEERAARDLQARMPAPFRTHYRRRPLNTGRKAGNIADFCRRWGSRYEYMVVLDADSVMEGATLVELVRLMERNPNAGLIQTMPLPVRQESLFGRFQQFANAVHGPMLAAGLSFWQGDAGNYWGHNAIIRIRPFMQHCDLPILPGKPPLGGEILSHDFVEAALLRRGGWDVWLLPQLGGSYEELPGNLIDYARRDRRWAQGNLQHLRLLGTPGLHGVSRLHLLFGAVAYLVSLLWLLMLAAGTGAAIGASGGLEAGGQALAIPESLRTPMAHALLGVTLVMLLLPKMLGIALAMFSRPRAFGGVPRLVASGVIETLFSVLIAPLMMAFHSLFVAAVALGRNVTWAVQPREGRVVAWGEAWRRTGGFVLAAGSWGLLLAWFAPGFFWWLMPVLAGLLLAPALVRWSSSQRAGAWMRRRGLLLAPSEVAPGLVLQMLHGIESPSSPWAEGLEARLPQRRVTWLRQRWPRPQPDWEGAVIRKAAGGN